MRFIARQNWARVVRRPITISAESVQLLQAIGTTFVPLATIALFSRVIVNSSDKRFTESKEASDKRFEASDKRFADMIATFSSVRGADKETLNAIVEKLAADIAVVNRAANKGAA